MARYVALFNQRDWDGLRALLADDVKLNQSTHPLRVGRADVGMFFTIYAKIDGVWLAPGWLEGREVIAVFEDRADPKPSYVMWLEWRDGRISFIRDYRYVRYVLADAELTLAPDAEARRRRRRGLRAREPARLSWRVVADGGISLWSQSRRHRRDMPIARDRVMSVRGPWDALPMFRIKPIVPPHRFWHGVGDALCFGVNRVDENVALQPGGN